MNVKSKDKGMLRQAGDIVEVLNPQSPRMIIKEGSGAGMGAGL